jgi:hypothetical protein
LQLRHDLPRVTPWQFDGEGEMRKVLSCVKSDNVLQPAFELHFNRWD